MRGFIGSDRLLILCGYRLRLNTQIFHGCNQIFRLHFIRCHTDFLLDNGTDAILGGNGLNIWTTGVSTINGSWSIGNHGDGIKLNTTNNTFINNTASIMNDYSGIYVIMDPLKILKLTNSTWFGNVRNPGSIDDKNLRVPGGVLGINVLIF